jgi:hypothetical protein
MTSPLVHGEGAGGFQPPPACVVPRRHGDGKRERARRRGGG